MDQYTPYLTWIDEQFPRMLRLLSTWSRINSGTYNLTGLARVAEALASEFCVVGGIQRLIELPGQQIIDSRGEPSVTPLGKALLIQHSRQAPLQVLLNIHMDTVYGPDDPFQELKQIDSKTLNGPGVADAKGGLVVMLIALEALQRTPWARRIGWEVLINPDEEIGSPGSAPLLIECAKRNHLGLLFEPAFADGALVSQRKGSGNFSVVIRGKAAHVGRDFASGRSAVHAAAHFVHLANGLNRFLPSVTINVGKIDGGGPSNVVADLAIVRLNSRISAIEDQTAVERELAAMAEQVAREHEVQIKLHGGFLSPPKLIDGLTRRLYDALENCGVALGIPITWRQSGGVSDANKLAAAGLPVIDTLGPRGGNLHSPDEFVLLNSLVERAKLAALLLIELASGQIQWPVSSHAP